MINNAKITRVPQRMWKIDDTLIKKTFIRTQCVTAIASYRPLTDCITHYDNANCNHQ